MRTNKLLLIPAAVVAVLCWLPAENGIGQGKQHQGGKPAATHPAPGTPSIHPGPIPQPVDMAPTVDNRFSQYAATQVP